MSEQWQDWFDAPPGADGWARFCAAFADGGLGAAVASLARHERRWGATHSLRQDLLVRLARDEVDLVRRNVARNPHPPSATAVETGARPERQRALVRGG